VIGVSHIVGRVELGHIIPLDDYFDSWEDSDNLVEGMVDYGMFDEQLYGLGYNSSPPVFVWRKDYFEEAGLDPELPPQNWEEMLEYAEKLTITDGDKWFEAAWSC